MHLTRSITHTAAHRVRFTRAAWRPDNPAVIDAFAWNPDDAPDARVLTVVDRGYLDAAPDLQRDIEHHFAQHAERLPRFAGFRTIAGGEAAKNDLSLLEGLLRDLRDLALDRRSYVLAIGGGAVLDMAGFAAAVCHRGVRLIRMPTTTLAQGDSGVGVKNAVNMFGSKNFIGAFAVPHAVLNDLDALRTLPDEHWRAGFSEAVKVALLKDADFFTWLEQHAPALRNRDEALAQHAWQRSAELHLDHIALGGDPFEQRAARPLDFGHWAAHRLEELTDHQLPHGHAVAIGLALDLTYAAAETLITNELAQRAITLLETLGLPTTHPLLADPRLLEGLENFRQHLGGPLTLTLIHGLSQPVDVHDVNPDLMQRCAQQRAALASTPTPSRT